MGFEFTDIILYPLKFLIKYRETLKWIFECFNPSSIDTSISLWTVVIMVTQWVHRSPTNKHFGGKRYFFFHIKNIFPPTRVHFLFLKFYFSLSFIRTSIDSFFPFRDCFNSFNNYFSLFITISLTTFCSIVFLKFFHQRVSIFFLYISF